MVEMQLQVGQANCMSLHPIGIVMVNLEINNKQFEHTFIVCQNLSAATSVWHGFHSELQNRH